MMFSTQLIQQLGYDPMGDLDHDAIAARGGDSYGCHVLLCCPHCRQPVFHDFEHDFFYPHRRTWPAHAFRSPATPYRVAAAISFSFPTTSGTAVAVPTRTWSISSRYLRFTAEAFLGQCGARRTPDESYRNS